MALTTLQVLDKAMEAGGTALTGKALAGTGKETSAVLTQLCAQGLLKASGGKSPKYSLTPEGRVSWEREAPPERRRELQLQEEQRQRQQLLDFLRAVEKKSGRALSRPEQVRFPEPLREDAARRKLVQPGSKANSYLLLPSGQMLLQADQPVEQQVKRLDELHQQTASQWRAAQQRLQAEVEQLGGEGVRALRSAAADLDRRGTEAAAAFEKALAELSAFAGLLSAAREFKAAVEAPATATREQLRSEAARLSDLEQRLRQANAEQREQLEALDRQVKTGIEEMARRVGAAGANAGAGARPDHHPSAPTDDQVWEATRQAYQRLHQETLRLGGIVKVPELTDAVRRSLPGLTAGAVHDLLLKWRREDRLTLQLCNDRRLEPRAAEGIESPDGLLFYVQMP